MEFIKDLQWASHLSERFRDEFEKFLPKWLESLVPYYQEAKKREVDLLCLQNIMYIGKPCDGTILFESNGIGYTQLNTGVKRLGFDGNKNYRKCNWLECYCEFSPDYNTASLENIVNSLYFRKYMTRHSNIHPENAELANRCNSYFQQITGDNNACLSLSGTSFISFNEKGLKYITNFHLLD